MSAAGYVDLQCNGGFGIDLASEPERLWELAGHLPSTGVTAWLPTIVSSPPEIRERALAALHAGPPDDRPIATPLGLHFEGPFLSPAHRGAHPAALLREPDLDEAGRWSREGGVAMVTLAPELPGALDVVASLVERGVVVSLGHSGATAEEATRAIDAGATMVTHLFNGMAPFHHRQPGLVGVALTDERVHVGLICDGVHVAPVAVALAARALGPRLVLVTDAVAGPGRLADGTLAGSVVAMDEAVRNLAAFAGWSMADAVAAASSVPTAVLARR